MTVTAYIALGSNLGDRRIYLGQALALLRAQPGISVGKVSRYHETAPVGGPAGQGNFLNAAAQLQTDLPPVPLLQVLLQVEQQLGRVRRERDGPRTIDLDLLLYGDVILDEPGLSVPHRRLHQRLFVLVPLAEIAANVVHPVLQRTIGVLLDEVKNGSRRELAGLRTVVTGSTSGIGRAIALDLAAGGANVIIHGRRSPETAEGVAAESRTAGVCAQVMMADLREPDECRRLAEKAWDHWQGLDIWVNNAGADTLTGEAQHWPFEQKLRELLAVDVTATLLLSREIGQRMKDVARPHSSHSSFPRSAVGTHAAAPSPQPLSPAAGERGRGEGADRGNERLNFLPVIINMGWDQAETGMAWDSGQLFAAAKAAVMAFSKSLAMSLAPQVRVNCVAPGWIRTAWGETASEYWQERVRRETPLERWGTPADVAAMVRWLVSPAASFITGQVIRVNGGAVR